METTMCNRIKVATIVGALFAAAVLLVEHGPAGVGSTIGTQAHAVRANPSPFDQHLRYSRI
jgi:hypothetical protein